MRTLMTLAMATAAAVSPALTVNPAVVRTGARSAVVSGAYQCEPSPFQAVITVAVRQTSPTGAPVGGTGSTKVTCTGLMEPYTVTIGGTILDGPGTVHAVIKQTAPAQTASFDGPVVVA
jgi:hypothetical protein